MIWPKFLVLTKVTNLKKKVYKIPKSVLNITVEVLRSVF